MPLIASVTSLDFPGIQPFRISRHSRELQHEGLFVAEGEKVVSRLFDSNLAVVSVLLTTKVYDHYRERFESGGFTTTQIFLVEESLVSSIVGYDIHQGVMALGKVPIDSTIEDCMKQGKPPCLFVALEKVVNADNVGGIVRNSAAFGVDLMIVGKSSSSPYYRRAVRNSMGTIFHLPVCHTKDLGTILLELKSKYKFRIIAAHPDGGKQLHEANFLENSCLMFGNEDKGIDPALLAICDETITIPMKNETDSLNVANASAVFLYEVMRQRNCTTP